MQRRSLPTCVSVSAGLRQLHVGTSYSWKEVAYVAESAHALQALDIAIPRRIPPRAKLPTCVFVHGGSWQRGDKSGGLNQDIDEAFVRTGYLGVSVNYRMSPEVQHPEHVKDVAAAVTWLHRNIAKVVTEAFVKWGQED
jgi:acetyl esterase/lipase